MKKTNPSSVNEGIQGSVNAQVVAVGRGASAHLTNYGSDSAQLLASIEGLQAALASMNLSQPAREAVADDVKRLQETASQPKVEPQKVAGVLESLAGKLKMVGVVLKDAVEIAGPVKQIAALLHLSLPFL